ncbi:MAG: redox-regulated ATPase YchF [Bacilli bacterium]
MQLRAGIIGLPNVGKSTLFNAITRKQILAANYPFATIESNVGMVLVPDERLMVLNNMYKPLRLIPTQYEFIDIAGLVKGASNGEGLGNKFLSCIREVDAIVHVVRCFVDKDIIHVNGEVNPIEDVETINVELSLSDLEIVENRLKKIEKKATNTNEKETIFEFKTLKKLQESLSNGVLLRLLSLSDEELELIKPFNLITMKPIIYVANVSEEDILGTSDFYKELEELAIKENSKVVPLCAKFESDLIELTDDEKKEFLIETGINTGCLDKLINITYELLNLKTFFTVGTDEVRAWTFKEGSKAPACAGIIHTDFEKGFIKAEVISYDDLISAGSEMKTKENGKLRLEGKEYVMKDGDICHFRFNVTK